MIAIVGPTASGKTQLALDIAKRFDVEVVSADSRQVYRGMDIGTAKPSKENQGQVKHHLLDTVYPDEEYNLFLFLKQARVAIHDIRSRGKIPLIVGGTGQYFWGLINGCQTPEAPPNEGVRSRLRRIVDTQGPNTIWQLLRDIDPESATSIHPNNVRRVIRALEIYQHTGIPMSQVNQKRAATETTLIIGITQDRNILYEKIDARVDMMINMGWIEEVKLLMDQGYDSGLPSMSGLGYKEIASHIINGESIEEVIKDIKYSTHHFAKSQGSWFKINDDRINWINATKPSMLDDALDLISQFLLVDQELKP